MRTSRRQLAALIATSPRSATAKAIAAYLLNTNQANELAPLLRDVARERIALGMLEVVAISARPLSPAVLRDVHAAAKQLYPAAKHITITKRLDPSLIGGVRVEIGECELDLSVRGRLDYFRAAVLRGVS